MKKWYLGTLPLLLTLTLLVGCSKKEAPIDGPAVLAHILSSVKFETELKDAGTTAPLYFPDLPEGSQVSLYTGSGYYADEAALVTLPHARDADAAMKVVQTHLKELKDQFRNYVPAEVSKIENAVTYRSGEQILLVITKDTETLQAILNGSSPAPQAETAAPEAETSTGTSAAEATATFPIVPETTAPDAYPSLRSQSGTYYDYGSGVIRVDDAAYELYSYNGSAAHAYADVINSVEKALHGQVKVYDLAIPTGSGIILPDDIAKILPGYTNQGDAIHRIFENISDDVVKVSPYDNMMHHRDEYLYFHTDYHWNGKGAYYAYEAFCQAKGVTPYTLSERKAQTFDGFLGGLYFHNSGKDPILQQNPDTVEAYHPHSPNASMRYTDQKGNTYDWNIIMDVSGWNAGSKYSTFAAADNPIAIFQNPDVTDGSVAIVVKESYGNALLPYLVDHYSTIYEIDYRYWSGSLVDFAREKQADDLIFANNLSMIGSNLLIGKLANVAK